ncbi:phosphate uptake regulator PhoU [Candidatus Woesearchaeota archaeon]|nr:phosphate uptake regulator PhoU [Candidatus Woesearchaeota archaeon]
MESRKLIKFGNSSHVVSLPTSWLKKNNLNKGNTVFLKENGNDLIVSYALKEELREQTAITINSDNKDTEGLAREIVSAYLNRFNTINIVGREIPKRTKEISDIIHNLVALEIVEQTSNKIIAKDFLKLEEVSISEIVRKVDITTRSMLEDAKASIDKNNHKTLFEKDKNINKLCFLLFKVMRNAVKEPQLVKTFKLNFIDIFDYWILVTNLEHIADEAKRASRAVAKIKLNEQEKEELKKIFLEIETAYIEIMKAFYQKDKEIAYKVSSKKVPILRACDAFLEKHQEANLTYIIERVKGMNNSIKNISRSIYDR